ncbi:unnamed protein product, partial [Allacma fusca]
MAGRKRDIIWLKFQEVGTDNRKGKRAKCNDCGIEMEGLIKRMKKHLEKCEPEIEEVFALENLAAEPANSANSGNVHIYSPIEDPCPLRKFITKTSNNEKKVFDEQVARFVFSSNSAFRIVSDPEFVKLVTMLRPGYIPPSRESVGEELLNQVYEKERQMSTTVIKGSIVSLSLDGWSNVTNDPIICSSITTSEGKCMLLETIDTSGHPHNAEYLLELVERSINVVKTQYDATVGSVVTDNAANVARMRRLLEEKDHSILTYGCSAHLLNLLSKDIQLANVKTQVTKVVKYFRNNHFASSKYKSTKKNKLVLPSDVRWSSLSD